MGLGLAHGLAQPLHRIQTACLVLLQQLDHELIDGEPVERRPWVVRFLLDLDTESIALLVACPGQLLEADQRLAEQLTCQVQHAGLGVRGKLVPIDPGAAAKGLQAALDVVDGGGADAVAGVLTGRPGQPGNASGDHFGLRVGLRSSHGSGCDRRRSPCRATSAGDHSPSGLGNGLAVGVDGAETVAGGGVRHEQLVEIEHRTDIGLRGAPQGAQRMNAGGHGRGIELSRSGRRLGGFDGDHDLILADADDVAVLHAISARESLRDRLLVVVEKDAVRAEIVEEIVPVAILHATVVGGYVPQRIGQHPIIVGGAPEGAAVDTEYNRAAITQYPPVITDDAQAKRHAIPRSKLCKMPVRAAPPPRTDI